MRATTIGTGPFKPAIEHKGILYVASNATFKNEDTAYLYATAIVTRSDAFCRSLLGQMRYRRATEDDRLMRSTER